MLRGLFIGIVDSYAYIKIQVSVWTALHERLLKLNQEIEGSSNTC